MLTEGTIEYCLKTEKEIESDRATIVEFDERQYMGFWTLHLFRQA